VLLVDTDTQGQAGSMLGVRPAVGLAELAAGEAALDQAIVQARERLWLLAGGVSLAGLQRMIDKQEFGGERALSEALAAVAGQYDYVLLDSAPGWGSLTVNVLFYAEEVLAPVSLEVMTIQGLLQFIQRLQPIQKYRQELRLRYVLPTFLDGRVKKSEEILRQLQQYYGQEICPPIRYNVRLSEAPGYGRTIFEYDARSSGAQDYALLTERIMQDDANP